MKAEEHNGLNGMEDSRNVGDGSEDENSNGHDDQLGPAVRDALIKRAEAEALQVQRDHEITVARTQEEEDAVKKQSVKTAVPDSRSIKPQPTANQQKQKQQHQAAEEANQAAAEEETMKIVADQASLSTALMLKEDEGIKQEHKNSGIMKAQFSKPQQSGQLSFFSKKEAAIAAGGIPVKGLPTTQVLKESKDLEQEHDMTAMSDLIQMAAEINETAKMEKFAVAANSQDHNNSTAIDDLMQMATELNENAKMEKIANASNSIVQSEPIQQRPGAYMGVPGEALQRANNIRFSLVGASTTGPGEPLVQMDDEASSTLLQTRGDLPTISERQLAVANLVLEDEDEEKSMPAADPVDMQQLQDREQKKKRQKLVFIAVAVSLFIVAAATVGAVVRTQNQREPEAVVLPLTESPTSYGSMTPSEVPSSAPTGALDLLLDSLPDYTLASINNGSDTPQWRAWNWLANHQNITFLPEWRKEQLFALATFFYAFEGDNWNPLIKGHGWMDDTVEECDWFSSGFGYFTPHGQYREWRHPVSPCDELGQYTSLNLGDLQLSGVSIVLPRETTLMTSLSRLHLNYNDFAGPFPSFFQAEFSKMTALTSLDLSDNQLTGSLSSELGLLTSLKRLCMSNTQMSHLIPSELGLLTSLGDLELPGNRLTGRIPSELGLLTSLNTLKLEWNQLSGPLPSEVGKLTALKWFNSGYNELSGLIPSELGLMTSLEATLLAGNRLFGPISSELGLLTTVYMLHLADNQLSGAVPSEIGEMTALNWLELNQNQLTSQMPSELGLLTDLFQLSLNVNQLSGQTAIEVGQLALLEELYLEYNQLTGPVPSELGALTALDFMWLNDNQFTGPVPLEIWLLTSLRELYLNDNQFSGTIPTEVSMMTSLTSLALENNDLTGALPSQLNASMGLSLYGNQFSGTVPDHLCSLLGCNCSLNETPPVSTCAGLTEAPVDWPGLFPTSGADVMLNIQTDEYPEETSWIWQQETNVTGIWGTLESGGPLEDAEHVYSSLFPFNGDAVYRLIVSDSFGDGIPHGWITLTATNQTVLYSLVGTEEFSEITVDVLAGADGSIEVTNSTAL
ncbi:expressed unknown protein [Seminavis robusta]|uniref:Uncharacterized protein n=1 Tax=Seminavis robusta TaxID=568900 RepID=A0A9N8HIT1_9STRA|nr:expressed unknown protein [Seminavis robusta]|eukprot:Sro517_g158711.1  (1078) ;mRNA; r:43812-47045